MYEMATEMGIVQDGEITDVRLHGESSHFRPGALSSELHSASFATQPLMPGLNCEAVLAAERRTASATGLSTTQFRVPVEVPGDDAEQLQGKPCEALVCAWL